MDFLNRFVCDGGGSGGRILKEETLEENVELSLGLSLNGRFGVERRRVVEDDDSDDKVRLIRASSIADFSSFLSVTEDPAPLTVYSPLTRTCSLPIETEEEWKKRKELQSLRRSEAKRKRVEKLKNGNYETKRRNILMNGNVLSRLSPPSMLPPLPRPSPVSVGSPASGGSSGVSGMESQPYSGTNKDVESKSRVSQQSVSHEIMNSSNVVVTPENASQMMMNGNQWKEETLKMMFAGMPCVSTKGKGVNGKKKKKKIEGFLYRYRKGEEVRIVCVCHGSFLTPAEFVKHGGGGGVELQHPLRHILINPPA